MKIYVSYDKFPVKATSESENIANISTDDKKLWEHPRRNYFNVVFGHEILCDADY